MTTPDAKAKADALLDKLLKGKQIHDLFASNMRNHLLISGQSLDDLEKKFKLKIQTDSLTPEICKMYAFQLMNLNQEAAFYYAVANAKSQMLKRSGESTYRDRFYAIVQEYKTADKKLPANATLENLARIENDDLDSAEAIAEIEKRFWQDILDHLSSLRKLIENATFNSSVEAKLLIQNK
jgi:hypothetical protein